MSNRLYLTLENLQPLSIQTILKMRWIQLVAESHDQGFADVPSAGNWTWLEVAIMADAAASQPKVVGGVEMVWTSHHNNFLTSEYGWVRDSSLKHELIARTNALAPLLGRGKGLR